MHEDPIVGTAPDAMSVQAVPAGICQVAMPIRVRHPIADE